MALDLALPEEHSAAHGAGAPEGPEPLEVAPVLSGVVPQVWDHVRGFVAAALPHGPQYEHMGDIYERLTRGNYQLWLLIRESELTGAVVTSIEYHPAVAICRIQYAGGEDAKDWAPVVFDTLRPWARDHGCKRFEFMGRRGWAKVLKEVGAKRLSDLYGMDV